MRKLLLAAVAAIGLLAPISAAAQEMPSYAQPVPQDQQIRGRIASFDGGYNLTVRDDKGYLDNVRLHQGTIINPTGLTLAPGMIVSILGYNAGPFFAANEVDTPYTFTYGVPYYYGHPWWYWGPSVSLGFFFGNPGWWHGGYFYGGYHYYHGIRVYNAPVRGVYHSGTWHGRNYVAPPSRGGYVPHGVAHPDGRPSGHGGGRPF